MDIRKIDTYIYKTNLKHGIMNHFRFGIEDVGVSRRCEWHSAVQKFI